MPARATKVSFAAVVGAILFLVSGCAGMVSSAPTTPAGTAPLITNQPQNQSVVAGATATFTVVATGSAPLTYQWQNNGAPISGANAAMYTTPPTSTGDNNSMFQVVISNSAGSVTSTAGELTVTASAVPPSVTSQPASATVMAGQTATFTVAASGTQPFTYQWQKNGAAISGATMPSYTTPATTTADNGSTFQVAISNPGGTTSSAPATLSVNADPVAPGIVTQPSNQSVLAGQTATFSVAASGTQPFTYQWQKNGAAISGAVSANYTTPATTSADNGSTFVVVVTNSAGTISSTPATLTVNPDPVAPSITSQPASRSVTAGQTATFTVVANGTAPLSFQWQKNGAAITGATATSYTTPATTTNDNGSTFMVIVTNSVGSAMSTTATLTVTPATVAPSFTAQPVSATVTAGQTATFSVGASGTQPLTYQWQKNGGAISGANSPSYTTPATTTNDNGAAFQVVVSNSAGTITSNAATLTVNAAAVVPTFSAQPASTTVTAGQTATFTVAANGTSPLTYQWQKNGAAISGATASSYTTPATTTADNGSKFVVVVSNSAGSVSSAAATLTVNAAPVAPTMTTQPASVTVTAGQTATFTVVANGTAPLTYQWQKNGAAISGATATSYTTPATTTADNGSKFVVVVSNSAGNATSSAATLTVNPAPVAPSVTTQPASVTVTAGQTATFSVAASGTSPFTYQWQKNGAAISGATAASYTTPATTTADTGSKFIVVVSNSAGNATSGPATLTVNPAPVAPTVTTPPASVTVTAGQTATFSVAASGTSPFTYQWQKNGAVISGATAASYTTPATTTADSGSKFIVVVSNSAGNATSGAATLTVNPAVTAPSITTQPASQSVMVGKTATFTVTASGTSPLTYQWQKNGTAVSNGTASTYTTPVTTSADNGSTFVVVVSNSAGNATSSSATLTVTADTTPPTVSITSPTAGSTVSGTVTVTASASDNVAVANVQLQVDGTNVGSADTTSPYTFLLATTSLSNGSHSLTAVATDTSGNHATSTAVAVTVSNQQASGATPTYANNGSGCPVNQVSTNLTDTVTSYSCPLPNPTGDGNLLVIVLRYQSPAQSPTFRDNIGGNTYNEAISCTDNTNGHVSAIYYAENVGSGVNKVTVSFGSGTHYVQMSPYEFYNVATSSALDQAQCNVGSGTSVTAGALPALSASGDLVVQSGIVDSTTAIRSCTPQSQSGISWIQRETMVADNYPSCMQYGVYNATTSFSPTFNVSTSVGYISAAAAFRSASAGTPPPTSGIRVVYVQHDNTQNETATSIPLQYPISGNALAVLFTSGCASTSNTDCAYPTGISDGTNSYAQVGSTIISNFGNDGGNSSGSIWYAKGVSAGVYAPTYSMHIRSSGGNGNSFFMYDIAGAAANPLDTGFGSGGLASSTYDQTSSGSGGPLTAFTATPSGPNELILATVGAAFDSFNGLSSPVGAQFLSCNYAVESNSAHCDLNGGWGLFYNGPSTAAETWIWTHDTSQDPGVASGVALGIALTPAN
jgi:Bacterial Ig domain/Immunoglobulin domain/Immunoglobulin I-set domain